MLINIVDFKDILRKIGYEDIGNEKNIVIDIIYFLSKEM